MRKLQLIGASVIAAAGLLIGLQAHALAITPATTPKCTTDINNDPAMPGFITTCWPALDVAALELQYLAEVPTYPATDIPEEGPFATSYVTSFSSTFYDPAAATIDWLVGTPFIDCAGIGCFLFVKDGAHTPAIYAFNISGWNGMDDIVLTGFWPDNGAISHVEIWSGSQAVPEPSTLALFGLGLLGLGLVRRRTTAR